MCKKIKKSIKKVSNLNNLKNKNDIIYNDIDSSMAPNKKSKTNELLDKNNDDIDDIDDIDNTDSSVNELHEYEFGINTLRDQKIVDELTQLVYGNRKVDKTCYTDDKEETSIVVTIDKDFNTYIKEILYRKPKKSKYLEYLGKYNKLTKNEKSFDCPICFEDVEKNKAYRILECGHKFHKTCIDKWLYSSEKNSCPMCRMELIPEILDKPSNIQEI